MTVLQIQLVTVETLRGKTQPRGGRSGWECRNKKTLKTEALCGRGSVCEFLEMTRGA